LQALLKNLGTILLSLILAILVWIAAVREQNPPRESDYSQTIPIEINPPGPGLILADALPETVRLRLRAPESSWVELSPSKFRADVDLSELTAGLSDVPIDVVVSDPAVEIVRQVPQAVTVNLQVEQTITVPVKIEVLDDPPLGYIARPPQLVPEVISVTGPASRMGQVDEAVSQISIQNAKETIARTAPVLIRDRNDQLIAGLSVEPSQVQITVPIEQRFGYKDVAVSAVVVGQAAPGYWVSNIAVAPPRVTIVGNPTVIGSIPGFIETIPFNVDQATADIVQTVPLDLPNGVTVVVPEGNGTGAGGVQVTVEVSAIESGQTIQLPITQQGIDPAYSWSASPARADVILSGPIPRLQALRTGDVQVIVDLFGLVPGTYNVQPVVFLPDDLRLEAILPDTIEVTIVRLPTPTSTATPTTSPGPVASATLAATRPISIPVTPVVTEVAPVVVPTDTPTAQPTN